MFATATLLCIDSEVLALIRFVYYKTTLISELCFEMILTVKMVKMAVFGILRRVVSQIFTGVLKACTMSIFGTTNKIALMMEKVWTSETSTIFYGTTWRNISEGCHLRICRRDNLKCYSFIRKWVFNIYVGCSNISNFKGQYEFLLIKGGVPHAVLSA